jgi:leader peptidase (prepilin peptidase) / N-methyltransferase
MDEYIAYFSATPLRLIGITSAIGLCAGSFLNVVIYRLPIMLNRAWRQACVEYLASDISELAGELYANLDNRECFNLAWPLSRCPHCKKAIWPHQNIPVISFLLLRGRCAHCNAKISVRYPLIEALTAVVSVVVVWQFGATIQAAAALLLCWSLIALAAIDAEQLILPDQITFPLLWMGMIVNYFGIFSALSSSVIGTMVGYLMVWLPCQLHRIIHRREGMGHGDCKLFAALGAWFGWAPLPDVLLIACGIGFLFGIYAVFVRQRKFNDELPFGSFLSVAAFCWLIFVK